MKISTDKRLNPTLRKEAQSLRGNILSASKKANLPKRFKIQPSLEAPSVFIIDIIDKKQAEVPLFALKEVKEVLNIFFS